MILSVHFLFGAAVGGALNNPTLGLPIALASHYMLDSLPHREYSIDNVENISVVGWHKAVIDLFKVAFDFFAGLVVLILLLPSSASLPWLMLFGFLACVPDGLSFLHFLTKKNNHLTKHLNFHKRIHIHQIKEETSWGFGIIFQVLAVISSVVFLLSLS